MPKEGIVIKNAIGKGGRYSNAKELYPTLDFVSAQFEPPATKIVSQNALAASESYIIPVIPDIPDENSSAIPEAVNTGLPVWNFDSNVLPPPGA